MINVSMVAPDFRRLAKKAPPLPTCTWTVRVYVVIGIRGRNLENTHIINVANASAMEHEKGNNWYNVSVGKLNHTTAS
jgi:hypothetical protein